jgi:hypothetical protein
MYYTIKNIIDIKPYTLTLLFNNNEVRTIDFKKKLIDKSLSPDNPIRKLLNKEVFYQVDIDADFETIYWKNLLPIKTKDGVEKFGNYDFCPNMLYEISEPVNT